MENEQKKVDWYCPSCESYVSSERVTFEETHDVCGSHVEVFADEPKTKEQLAIEYCELKQKQSKRAFSELELLFMRFAHMAGQNTVSSRIAQLEAENSKLREALTEITILHNDKDRSKSLVAWESVAFGMYKLAEQALKQKNVLLINRKK